MGCFIVYRKRISFVAETVTCCRLFPYNRTPPSILFYSICLFKVLLRLVCRVARVLAKLPTLATTQSQTKAKGKNDSKIPKIKYTGKGRHIFILVLLYERNDQPLEYWKYSKIKIRNLATLHTQKRDKH